MSVNNEEAYQTLEWIISQSEEGLFLAVAEEPVQKDVIAYFRNKQTAIYDYRYHSESYTFHSLSEWIESQKDTRNFLIFNFQFAMQREQDFKRLNFSRDMLAGLKRNLIFFTTSYGDDRLVSEAYDFYSFLKMRILFQSNEAGQTPMDWKIKSEKQNIWNGIELDYAIITEEHEDEAPKLVMERTKCLLERADAARRRLLIYYAELCLQKAKKDREKLLGRDHLEMAEIYHKLGEVYEDVESYEKAEKYYKAAFDIRERALDIQHPDTISTLKCLMRVYKKQGAYEKIRKCEDQWNI